VFDPATIIDHATYAKPDQPATGVDVVLVNGQVEFDHGNLTGVTAGRVLRGRGYQPPATSK
jgi:N-acyl-D-amino-acid deacylase